MLCFVCLLLFLRDFVFLVFFVISSVVSAVSSYLLMRMCANYRIAKYFCKNDDRV